MTEAVHSLQLKIDAAAAEAGAKRFTAAIASVRRAVSELEKDSAGAFTALRSIRPEFNVAPLTKATSAARDLTSAMDQAGTSSTKIGTQTQRAALAASMALRQATTSAQKLAFRLEDLGDSAGVDRLDAAIDRLHAQLARAPDVAAVRVARSAYEDLRVELTQTATAAEYAKGALAQTERETREAARAAEQHAESLDRLRAAHDPLFAASQRYSQALSEIDRLTAANILNEGQANAARDRAAQTYLALDAAADRYAATGNRAQATTTNLMYNFQDLGVMLAAGQSPLLLAAQQGTQIGAALEASGAKGKQVLGLLKEAALSVVSPVNLITIGAIAAGAALFYAFQKAIPQTKSLAEALRDLESALSAAKGTAGEAASLDQLAEKYGKATREVQNLANARRDLARMDAADALREAQLSFQNDFGFSRWWDTLRGYANNSIGQVNKLRDDLDLTKESATQLNTLLREAMTAPNAEVAADKYAAMRDLITQSAGGLDKMTDEQAAFVRGLNDMEDKARQFVALDMARPVTDAKAQTDSWIGSMSGVAAQAERVLNTLQALSGLKINISAPTITTPSLPKATTVSAPAKPTVTEAKATGDLFDKLTNVEFVSYQPDATKPAASMTTGELQAVITASVTRSNALKVEGTTAKDLNATMQERLSALTAERVALMAVASGMYKSEEAARLYADAMADGKGAIDATTLSLIAQVDAANTLNEALTRAARDPVKEWLDAVPTWAEAGKTIQAGIADSLSSSIAAAIKTGNMDWNALGDAILGNFADVIAQKATAELMRVFGADDGGLLSGLFGDLGFKSMGDPNLSAMTSQAGPAGQTIAAVLMQQAPSIGAAIASGMAGVGPQIAASAQSGLVAGSNSVRTAAQTGLAMGANSVRVAATTAGPVLGQGVVQGAQAGAPILAQGVAAGAQSGGILSGVGGFGGLMGMILPGLFSEGGYSTSPVASAMVPGAAFHHAPRFSEGGVTSGGIPAVLHPNEAVIPLSRGRKIPVEMGDSAGGGDKIVTQHMTFNIQTPDADGMRRSQKRIAADMAAAGQRAMRTEH